MGGPNLRDGLLRTAPQMRRGERLACLLHLLTSKAHFQLAPIDSTAACAIFKSVCQSPPLTPTPPMHWPSERIGTPPSIAVQRSGPAASASPSACVRSRSWPTAPLAVVGRLLEAAHTALVVHECSVW